MRLFKLGLSNNLIEFCRSSGEIFVTALNRSYGGVVTSCFPVCFFTFYVPFFIALVFFINK